MNIRIISGKFGGRKINTPNSSRTHPMGERVRNALFNSLGQILQDANVLDVFAGTGALGFEAISRGSRNVIFVERDRLAQKIIQENIISLNIKDKAKVIKSSALNWLSTYEGESFDIILIDPPYYDPQFSTVEKLFGYVKIGGYVVLSHPGRGEVPTKNGVVVVDNRSYGNAYLTFYRRDA